MTRKAGHRMLWALLAVLVVAAAAALTWIQWAPPPQAAPDRAAQPSGFLDSATYVAATLTEDERGGAVVHLRIDPGWHVNAHPASLEGLIPTTVLVEQGSAEREVRAQYPPGRSSGIVLEDTDILVYDDGAAITLQEPFATPEKQLRVRVQSCNDAGLCLAPAAIAVAKDGPA